MHEYISTGVPLEEAASLFAEPEFYGSGFHFCHVSLLIDCIARLAQNFLRSLHDARLQFCDFPLLKHALARGLDCHNRVLRGLGDELRRHVLRPRLKNVAGEVRTDPVCHCDKIFPDGDRGHAVSCSSLIPNISAMACGFSNSDFSSLVGSSFMCARPTAMAEATAPSIDIQSLGFVSRVDLTDNALVFSDIDGGPLSPDAVSAAWSDYAKKIGMGDISFHALRHTHASQLIDAGVDIVTISKRLGHAKPDITLRVYAHLFRKDDSKAAAAINAALGG